MTVGWYIGIGLNFFLVFQFMRVVFLMMHKEVRRMSDLSVSMLMLVRSPSTQSEGEAGIVQTQT